MSVLMSDVWRFRPGCSPLRIGCSRGVPIATLAPPPAPRLPFGLGEDGLVGEEDLVGELARPGGGVSARSLSGAAELSGLACARLAAMAFSARTAAAVKALRVRRFLLNSLLTRARTTQPSSTMARPTHPARSKATITIESARGCSAGKLSIAAAVPCGAACATLSIHSSPPARFSLIFCEALLVPTDHALLYSSTQ